MLKRLACAAIFCAVLPLGAASASGPTFAIHHPGEPAVASDMGRIYFYRSSSILGFALQPAIMVDGAKVGVSRPGDYFYVDRPAGTYTVTTTTEKEETATVTLTGGQTVYVETSVSMGFLVGHVSPEVIANDKAEVDIKDCDFDGTAVDTAPAATASATTPAATPAATATPASPAAPSTTPTDSSAATATPAPATSSAAPTASSATTTPKN